MLKDWFDVGILFNVARMLEGFSGLVLTFGPSWLRKFMREKQN